MKKTAKKVKTPVLDAFGEKWPIERDILWRPERLKYIRRVVEPDPKVCVFCRARDQGVGLPSLVVAVSEHAMVLLNKYPYNTGHVLVLPKRHVGDLLELSNEEYADITQTLRHWVDVLNQAYKCQGLNVGLNLGAAAGAGIPEHIHFHVIPRWNGDSNFLPLIGETKVVSETLEQTFDRLIAYMKDMS